MLNPDPGITSAAPVFAALGDETRLSLISQLGDGQPRSIVQLAGSTDLTRQGVTKHLQVLEQAGIVTSKRTGRENRYALRPDAILEAKGYLARVARQWDEALLRLKGYLEDE